MALAFTVLAVLLTACGGDSGGSSAGSSAGGAGVDSGSPSPASPVTFTNDRYGFSFNYPAQFTKSKPKKEAQVGIGPVYDVIFADTNGARNGDAYLDSIDVSVYELARKVTQAEVAKLAPQLQDMLARSTSSLSDVKILQPLVALKVNGVPGFVVRYTFTDAGQRLTVAAYYLFKGKYEYQVTTQAAGAHWDTLKTELAKSALSFRVR